MGGGHRFNASGWLPQNHPRLVNELSRTSRNVSRNHLWLAVSASVNRGVWVEEKIIAMRGPLTLEPYGRFVLLGGTRPHLTPFPHECNSLSASCESN